MPTDNLAIYETWEPTTIVVPPRSRLFNLKPIGLGTPMVECLTSFFSRLAQAHCLSPGALIEHELMRRGAGARNMFSCKTNARSHATGINGKDGIAANFVLVLENLTARSDLKYLTMIPWRPLLSSSKFLMRNIAAWCPACLIDWEQSDQPVYIPLLWTLEVVKFCPSHRRPLRFTCPHCKLPQGVLGQRSWVGFCARCKRSLAADSNQRDSERYSALRQDTPEWEIWVANHVAQLIEAGLHDPPLLTKENLSELIQTATDIVGQTKLAGLLRVDPFSVRGWQMGAARPTFLIYLRLARVLNVRLADLLTAMVTPATIQSLCLINLPRWRKVFVPRPSTFNIQDAARHMVAAVREVPPPSLMAFRKRHRYTHGTLQRHLPDQCRTIQERYRKHCAALIEQRRIARIEEFRRIAYQLHDDGVDLCTNRIRTRMSVPCSVKYPIARQLLAEIRHDIANRKLAGKPTPRVGTRTGRPILDSAAKCHLGTPR